MNKRKCIVIPNVGVFDIKELTVSQYLEEKVKSQENIKKLEDEQKKKDEKISDLEKKIAKLELDIKLDRGEIDEKEYERLCGLM